MQKAKEIIRQVNNVVLGKSEIIEKVLMAMLAGGHVVLEDIPGVDVYKRQPLFHAVPKQLSFMEAMA